MFMLGWIRLGYPIVEFLSRADKLVDEDVIQSEIPPDFWRL